MVSGELHMGSDYRIKALGLALIIISIVSIIVAYTTGKKDGYKDGYKVGYADGIKIETEKPKSDTVQTVAKVETTTTTTIRPKTTADKADVIITTAPPIVKASVNGKKYEFKPQSEVLQTGVATTATLNIKVPERRWTIGLGTDGHKPAYMLKAPVKDAIGIWVAGSGRSKIMGGLSVSF